jgi:hypothetical protein
LGISFLAGAEQLELAAQPWLLLQPRLNNRPRSPPPLQRLAVQPWLREQLLVVAAVVQRELLVQPWQRFANSPPRALQLLVQPVAALVVQVVDVAAQPRQRLPKSTFSLPAVKASISTAEYILETSSELREANPR